jgi:hypothetical protein
MDILFVVVIVAWSKENIFSSILVLLIHRVRTRWLAERMSVCLLACILLPREYVGEADAFIQGSRSQRWGGMSYTKPGALSCI